MTAKKPRRRKPGNDVVPVPPEWFDPDAGVNALFHEMIGSPDAVKWRQLEDDVDEWCRVNDVELRPEWGGKVTARWLWDDTSGRVVRNR
ncbi:hypothetical protein Airi01_098390 [Actinoallomurus iriomotensis]|uniref:Uncharacterized protein n=1 Tax=Actinoallomurus iriomotensis TaxID=478107 RepID=A0A9W6RWU2_9ACTN|nr:hypothetical protein Airi01_098390 [Actinoallomurus iriomotensis]